jgi:hypothetical protein
VLQCAVVQELLAALLPRGDWTVLWLLFRLLPLPFRWLPRRDGHSLRVFGMILSEKCSAFSSQLSSRRAFPWRFARCMINLQIIVHIHYLPLAL